MLRILSTLLLSILLTFTAQSQKTVQRDLVQFTAPSADHMELTETNGRLRFIENTQNRVMWYIDYIEETQTARIQKTESNSYIHIENGYPQVGEINEGWHSAQWIVEKKAGSENVLLFKNKWKNTYLGHVNGAIVLTNSSSNDPNNFWKVHVRGSFIETIESKADAITAENLRAVNYLDKDGFYAGQLQQMESGKWGMTNYKDELIRSFTLTNRSGGSIYLRADDTNDSYSIDVEGLSFYYHTSQGKFLENKLNYPSMYSGKTIIVPNPINGLTVRSITIHLVGNSFSEKLSSGDGITWYLSGEDGYRKASYTATNNTHDGLTLNSENQTTPIYVQLNKEKCYHNGVEFNIIETSLTGFVPPVRQVNPDVPDNKPEPFAMNARNLRSINYVNDQGIIQGVMRNPEESGTTWYDLDPSGAVKGTFEEYARQEWLVYLLDRQRSFDIVLDLSTREMRIKSGSEYYKIHNLSDPSTNGGTAPQQYSPNPTPDEDYVATPPTLSNLNIQYQTETIIIVHKALCTAQYSVSYDEFVNGVWKRETRMVTLKKKENSNDPSRAHFFPQHTVDIPSSAVNITIEMYRMKFNGSLDVNFASIQLPRATGTMRYIVSPAPVNSFGTQNAIPVVKRKDPPRFQRLSPKADQEIAKHAGMIGDAFMNTLNNLSNPQKINEFVQFIESGSFETGNPIAEFITAEAVKSIKESAENKGINFKSLSLSVCGGASIVVGGNTEYGVAFPLGDAIKGNFKEDQKNIVFYYSPSWSTGFSFGATAGVSLSLWLNEPRALGDESFGVVSSFPVKKSFEYTDKLGKSKKIKVGVSITSWFDKDDNFLGFTLTGEVPVTKGVSLFKEFVRAYTLIPATW